MKRAALVLLSALLAGGCKTTIDPIEIDLSKKTPAATPAPSPPPTPTPASTRVSGTAPPAAAPGPESASRPVAAGKPAPAEPSETSRAAAPPQAPAPGSVTPAAASTTSEEPVLYRATLVQAAPGKLLDLVEAYKTCFAAFSETGDEAPLWMRHSQGDRWDLLLLFPMGSWADYERSERIARRQKGGLASPRTSSRLREDIAWQEDVFVFGPPLAELRARCANAAFFHVEMFEALAGRQADLRREREKENVYSKRLSRPENLIFVKDQGAAWDLFTIGCYRDLKHYAESADITETQQEAAAKAAGFDSARDIGPLLRTLIRQHHDTLAVAVK